MAKTVLSKLFKSYIAIIIFIGITAWLLTSIITLHDSRLAYNMLSKIKQIRPCVDDVCVNPNGNIFDEMDKLELNLLNLANPERKDYHPADYYAYEQTLKEAGLSVMNDRPFYTTDRWGDMDFSNISYLWFCSLWLVGASVLVGVSFGIRKWLTWLFRDETKA